MTRPKNRPAPPRAWDKPDGYYTEPCRKWWGQGWKPMTNGVSDRLPIGRPSILERERQTAEGIGWGSGTTPLPGTPKHARPGWL
jgi:hypothetical protein